MLVDTITQVQALTPGQVPTDRILVDLGVDPKDGLHYFLTTDVVGDEFDLAPADLAACLHSAIEAVHCDPPEDQGNWEGVSLMIVQDEDITSDVGGWICKKCDLLVGGSVEVPPDVCPICEAKP